MRLIIEDDVGRRTVVPLAEQQVSIGREEGNTVRLAERNISRRHARIFREGEGFAIEDLGSFNGVRVNGDRVQGRHQIGAGDLIQIGDYDLALQEEPKLDAPDRTTLPNLTPPPDATDPDHTAVEAFPFHDDPQALAQLRKVAAGRAALGKRNGPSDERDTDPKGTPGEPSTSAPEPQARPADFHAQVESAAAIRRAESRRRMRRTLMVGGATLGAATLLAFAVLRPPRPSNLALDAVVEDDPPPKPTVGPAAAAVAPAATVPVAAPAQEPRPLPSVPAPTAAAPTPASAQTAPETTDRKVARRKALVLYQEAVAEVGSSDYAGALSKLQLAVDLDASSPEIHKEMAICYSHLRHPDKGAYHWEQYLKLRPQAPDAADVRKMLRDYYASKVGE